MASFEFISLLRPSQAMQRKRLPDSFRRGLASVEWPGRAQVVPDTDVPAPGGAPRGSLTFYLDGAHTPESMEVCATWFCESVEGGANTAETSGGVQESGHHAPPEGNGEAVQKQGLQNGVTVSGHSEWGQEKEKDGQAERTGLTSENLDVRRVLLFNCMQEREPVKLLDPLIQIAHSKGESSALSFLYSPLSCGSGVVLGIASSLIPVDAFGRTLLCAYLSA